MPKAGNIISTKTIGKMEKIPAAVAANSPKQFDRNNLSKENIERHLAALDVLRDSPAASRQMETKGPKMVAGDFSVQARLGQHLKDVDLILEAAADAGVTLMLATAHRALLDAAVAAGLGDLDNSAIIGAYRPPGPRHGGGHPT